MSEVDRLSNSGLYPALPIADKNPDRQGSRDKPAKDPEMPSTPAAPGGSESPRPPKSIIDEYA